jgi:hypothetical protein
VPARRKAAEKSLPMFTSTTKWFSVLALLWGLLWSWSAGFRMALEMGVFVAATLVVVQAMRTGKYGWGVSFIALAVLFNPALPVPLTRRLFLGLEWFSIGAFLVSLAALKTTPQLSMPAISGRMPGSESL